MNPDPLAQLRDIHLPADPAFWPPAPGWWVLALCVLGLAAWLARIAWRIHRRRRPLRTYLAALRAIDPGDPDAIRHLSSVTRRYAIARFGRERVASLQGEGWLDFLGKSSGLTREFARGEGAVLASAPYARHSSADTEALRRLLARWAEQAGNRPC